jgi:hypothetical protein
MGFDIAHPSRTHIAILCSECVFKAFNYPLMMALTKGYSIAGSTQSDIGEGENSVVGCLKSKIVGDSFHFQIRLSTAHDAEEAGNLVRAGCLSLQPTEFRQLL